jgi:hypothetical protein
MVVFAIDMSPWEATTATTIPAYTIASDTNVENVSPAVSVLLHHIRASSEVPNHFVVFVRGAPLREDDVDMLITYPESSTNVW